VFPLFSLFLEEVPFFHSLSPTFPAFEGNSNRRKYKKYSILGQGFHNRRSGPAKNGGDSWQENRCMAKRKRRPEKFSIVKAVKANARERIGQPRPERVIVDDQKRQNSRKPKHRQTMPQLLIGE
jgi:hypothetical protein